MRGGERRGEELKFPTILLTLADIKFYDYYSMFSDYTPFS